MFYYFISSGHANISLLEMKPHEYVQDNLEIMVIFNQALLFIA